MCGIAGKLGATLGARDVATMIAAISHRGPDASEVAAVGDAVLGAARLAITGGPFGVQPRRGSDGSLFALNGQIFNHEGLAARRGTSGASDTAAAHEHLIAAGIEAAAAFRGPFALALASRDGKSVALARDAFGQRPLYYARCKGALVFASEVRALLAMGIEAALDAESLDDWLVLNAYRPGRTLFRDIFAVEPGTILWARLGEDREIALQRTRLAALRHADLSVRAAFDEACALHGRRSESAALFLSGGLDSTALASGLERVGSGADLGLVGAFPEDPRCDERVFARAAAAAAGLSLAELSIDASTWAAALPATLEALEMPVAGPGAVATLLLARAARRGARIVFAGQGGDELFGGYERLRLLQWLEVGALDLVPDAYRPLAERMLRAQAAAPGDDLAAHFGALDRAAGRRGLSGDMHRGLERARARWRDAYPASGAAVDRAAAFETTHLLPALLHVDDRITAGLGMEVRAPFLDQRLFQAAAAVPFSEKSPAHAPRRLFRTAFADLLPPLVRERRDKMGFPVPLAAWWRGPLRSYAESILLSPRAAGRGILDPQEIPALLEGDGQGGRLVYNLVMLELWFRRFIDRPEAVGQAPAVGANREVSR